MRIILTTLLTAATLVLAVVTFLALSESNVWWIRMTDFPRLQYLVALAGLAVCLALARPVTGRLRLSLAAIIAAAIIWNAVQLMPYAPIGSAKAASCTPEDTLSVMVANVQLRNNRAEALLDIVRNRDPDVLVALETNAWWDERLAQLDDTMPHSVAQITGSYFGMHLRSRLPLAETRTVFPADQDAPAILATVALPSGQDVQVIGLHPRPPHPGQSSLGRDAELMWGAFRARDSAQPVVLAGDLNAVPWERSIERLQRIGGLIDPRRIEGFLPTYDAQSWWMAWPLDQVLYQDGMSVVSMEVLPGFGSDHYPIEVTLCARPGGLEAPELRPDDLSEAQRTLAAAIE